MAVGRKPQEASPSTMVVVTEEVKVTCSHSPALVQPSADSLKMISIL